MTKGIRFNISDDLHRKLRTKLSSEGRKAKELFITLTELYVGENETKEKDGLKKSRRKG